MSNSIFAAKVIALKRRAVKVEANADITAQFLKMAEGHYISVANGNGNSWRKYGQVGQFITEGEGGKIITTYLIVKTVWNGMDYTTITKIERSVLAPNCGYAFETVASHEVTRHV